MTVAEYFTALSAVYGDREADSSLTSYVESILPILPIAPVETTTNNTNTNNNG